MGAPNPSPPQAALIHSHTEVVPSVGHAGSCLSSQEPHGHLLVVKAGVVDGSERVKEKRVKDPPGGC